MSLARRHLARFAGVNFHRSWARAASPRSFTTESVVAAEVEEDDVAKSFVTEEEEETVNTTETPIVRKRAMALPSVSPNDAVESVVESARAKFDETVELSLGLGIDPRKPNQQFRSMAQLPHGTGKKAIIAVFAQGEAAEKAKAAGASIVGAEDLLADIQAGNINFSRCIATPDMMPLVSRVARVLGPRGLMPNPKMGTVTIDVETAVSNAMKGEVELRADKFGFVNLPLGKVSFPQSKLLDNFRAVMMVISNEKPSGASGKYLKQAVVSSTMGKGVQVDVELLDPSSQKFMLSQ
jgi:large subunit ribosomal protein L1